VRGDRQQQRRQAVNPFGNPLGLLRTQPPDRRRRPRDGLKLPLKLVAESSAGMALKVALAGDIIAPHAWHQAAAHCRPCMGGLLVCTAGYKPMSGAVIEIAAAKRPRSQRRHSVAVPIRPLPLGLGGTGCGNAKACR
jgi:hypothetical protein